MAKIGFARVSTREQDLTSQINQLKKAGCTRIFQGKNSGKKESNAERLKELLNFIREDDIVIVTKIDRLGRSMNQVLTILDEFKAKKVGFKTLDGSIDTTKKNDPVSIALIQLLAMFSELERNFILSRTQDGKARTGRVGGRPKSLSKDSFSSFKKDQEKGLSINELSKKYNLSIASVLRYKKIKKY